MKPQQRQFINTMTNRMAFNWFLLKRLPTAWFWGVKITLLTLEECRISLPYRWSTTNPFRSIYFAALSGAAEMSSGVLCMLHLTGSTNYSMLVTDFQATFLKKADQPIEFVCKDGTKLENTISSMNEPGQTNALTMDIMGINKDGITVATFRLTWSFKRKN